MTPTPATARHPRIRHVTLAGQTLAGALVPLVVGVLLAKAVAGDPMTPVNALITNGGHRARIAPAELRRCGRDALGRLRPVRRRRARRPPRAGRWARRAGQSVAARGSWSSVTHSAGSSE
ncbi:hypothetical protein [Streptomyces sp. NPDC051211]|uniref:hypothetical protein n=1 Tax=Streptomyces sp. NPDC051211 TaxID=3154643 RepID=UPI00344D7431